MRERERREEREEDIGKKEERKERREYQRNNSCGIVIHGGLKFVAQDLEASQKEWSGPGEILQHAIDEVNNRW